MSVHWMSWVWDNGPEDSNERFVLLKLADNANQEGYCYPSMAELTRTTRLSESTVKRCLRSLEANGFLAVNVGRGRGIRSEYLLIKKGSDGTLSGSVKGFSVTPFMKAEKGSHRPKKGVTLTEKGVTLTEPPTPPIEEEPSRTVIEPSRGSAPLDFFDDEEQNIPDDVPDAPMGVFLLQRLSIPHSFGLAAKFANCVALLARDEHIRRGEAARLLLERARDHPPDSGKWRFWLEDGSWKQRETAGLSTEGWE